jgi:aspartate-semialdehyde dehydrogenase
VVPQIDKFMENDYTKEEMKMVNETRKIFEDDSIQVSATCVRVPVVIGHSEAVNVKTKKRISVQEVRKLLSEFPTVKIVDDPSKGEYPTPIDSAGRNETFVGRIREDISQKNGIEMWIVSDNLRRGAALNAVLIAERMLAENLI